MSSPSSPVFLFIISLSLPFFLPALSAHSPLPPSYASHCSSILPSSTTTDSSKNSVLPTIVTNYIHGGGQLWGGLNGTYYYGGRTLRIRIDSKWDETASQGVYRVTGFLFIRLPFFSDYSDGDRGNYTFGGPYYHRRRSRRSIRFALAGVWSETSRKACLVGSSPSPDYSGVLKLYYPSDQNPGIRTSVVSGTFESTHLKTDPGYFDPLSFYSFPLRSHYEYSLLSEELGGSGEVRPPASPSLDPSLFCNESFSWSFRSISLELDYPSDCKGPHGCSPLGNTSLPTLLVLKPIQCSDDGKNIRYLAIFQNQSYTLDLDFSFESVFIAEGSWDAKNDHMLIGACRIANPIDHFGVPVGDCDVRMSLRYPSVLTIREDSSVVGQIWSTVNSTHDPDKPYFRNITFTGNVMEGVVSVPAGLSYKYTELKTATGSCPEKKPQNDTIYPDVRSYDMRFDASVRNSKGEHFGWAYATPVFVGNDLFQGGMMFAAMAPASVESDESTEISEAVINASIVSVFNITYTITISSANSSMTSNLIVPLDHLNQVKIIAEGVYNTKTGQLCMVGCRRFRNSTGVSTDCDIRVQFNFAPLNARKRDEIKGMIKSTRQKNDSLHFEELTLSAAAFYVSIAEESVWRMDLEIILALVSNTLFCIFVGLQIFHVRKNPESMSSISLVMVSILALGHMIPLLLNVEAIFLENHNKQTVFYGGGGWLEANEVAVRVITMVAFLLQIRLLQLVWNSKQGQGNEKNPWTSEIKASFITLPLYILGALLAFLVSQARNRVPITYGYSKYSALWGDLRSYAGLLLDGFLFPQIVLNAVRGSTDKALAHPFYIGTSAVRLVPHAYNEYRAYNYPMYMNGTYYYANPVGDFYSRAWDVVIPLCVVGMAVVVLLQQRRGGRCILPKSFRELELYAKVPTMADNE